MGGTCSIGQDLCSFWVCKNLKIPQNQGLTNCDWKLRFLEENEVCHVGADQKLKENKLGQHQSQTPFSIAFWVQKDFQYKNSWVQKNVSSDQSWLDLTCPDLTCSDLTCPDLTCPDFTCPDFTSPNLPEYHSDIPYIPSRHPPHNFHTPFRHPQDSH